MRRSTSLSAARVLAAAAVAAAVALGATACGSGSKEVSIKAVKSGDGPTTFAPATITVDKSDRVKMKVGNQTLLEHGFSIEGYDRQKVVPPGQTIDVEFTAGKGGTYKIYCQLHPAHEPATLVVQ